MRYTAPVPPSYLGVGACPAVRYPNARRRSDAAVQATEAAAPGGPATLRAKARRLGVSHEAVRRAIIAAGEPTDLASRNRAIREMAISGAAWPEIARAFGMSPSGVRFVCRDLPRRKAGRRWHKTTEEKDTWRHGG
jgi:DNA-binding NarL/FixJ family response regulator